MNKTKIKLLKKKLERNYNDENAFGTLHHLIVAPPKPSQSFILAHIKLEE